MKRCRACEKKLVRRKGERLSNWSRRTCCGHDCRLALLHRRLRELDGKKKTLPCEGCGKPQERSVRMKKAVCPDCEDIRRQAHATVARHRLFEQARRYRMLMTVLGFESFEECLEYLRLVPWTQFAERQIRDLRSAA